MPESRSSNRSPSRRCDIPTAPSAEQILKLLKQFSLSIYNFLTPPSPPPPLLLLLLLLLCIHTAVISPIAMAIIPLPPSSFSRASFQQYI